MCCRYLAHMYMAECLVSLDCIADGIDHLNPDLVTDIGTVFPTEQKSEQGCVVVECIVGGNYYLFSSLSTRFRLVLLWIRSDEHREFETNYVLQLNSQVC